MQTCQRCHQAGGIGTNSLGKMRERRLQTVTHLNGDFDEELGKARDGVMPAVMMLEGLMWAPDYQPQEGL